MAKPNKNKKQRIVGFDFSGPGAHVAIVDKAANGSEGFTVLKSFSATFSATEKAEMKTVDGEKHPASDFAYVPDPNKSSTWKLPIYDATHASAAAQALSPAGFRGNKVEIPSGDLAGVKAKVRSAYKKFYPDKEVPESVRKDAGTQEIHSDASSGATCDKGEALSSPPVNINDDGGHSMTDVQAPEHSEDVTKALDSLKVEKEEMEAAMKAQIKDQAEKLEKLQKAEDDRITAAFEETAKSYASLRRCFNSRADSSNSVCNR